MPSDKLISLLKTFTKYELNQFRKYLLSPVFNENQDIINLFDVIKKSLVQGDKEEGIMRVEKTIVWKILFPQKKYDDNTFRRFTSELTRLAYGFLVHKKSEEDLLGSESLLLEVLNQPALDKHFNGALRQAEHVQEQSPLRHAGLHLQLYRIDQEKYRHSELIDPLKPSLENLLTSDFHLDCFWLSMKLKNYCEELGHQQRLKFEANIALFPGFWEYLTTSVYFEEPCVKAYYLVAQLLTNPDEEAFYYELKGLLEASYHCFPKQELNTLYTHLKNYCILTKINSGRTDYFRELFTLYQASLAQELIFENDFLPPNHYKNIITIGLQIGEISWVENFIQTYTDRLPEGNQDNARSYNLAKVYFHTGEYKKVIEQLRSVEYENLTYALGGKLMLLKTYFELQELKALDSLIDSFRIYLRRNKQISRDVLQQYLNVLRFTKKISSLAPYDRDGILKTKEQIASCKMVAAKDWLLQKVGEL